MKQGILCAALCMMLPPALGVGNPGARVWAATASQAQDSGKQDSAKADATSADAFTLGPEDVIEVSVRDHTELDHTLTVLPDGKIAYPTVGEMQAAGKTPRALALEIQNELETTLNNIHVTVTVKEIHSRRVRIVGAVKQAGGFDLKRDWHLFDLITAAGGLSAKPEQTTARIIRGGTQVLPVNIADVMRMPQSSANIALQRDDLVLVDEQAVVHRQAQVIGQVGKPSVYDIEADTTLIQLLAQAGNPTDKAALTRVTVLRNGMQMPVNLYPFLAEGKADEAVTRFKVQSGDVIFIPAQEARYAVQGKVGKPGYYTYPEKGQVTVLDAFNEAGGAADADLSKANIIRRVDGKYALLPVNIDQMLKKGDLSKNVAIQPGDMLYIPARNARRGVGLQDVVAPLSLLGLLGFRL